MSNGLAIATVTAAIGQIVHASAKSAVPGTGLRFGRPPVPEPNLRHANIYLYQALPYGPLRNEDEPMRDSSGRLINRPRAALELHYLFSFYGDDTSLEPDRMLGAVWRDLHENSVLSRQSIQDAIDANQWLAGSDLPDAAERVKLTPLSLSLDDLSRLWSVMVQRPHALSMTWQAAVVLIDGLGGVLPSRPVLKRGSQDRGPAATASHFPRLDRSWFGLAGTSDRQPRPPSLRSAQLGCETILEGEHLDGDSVAVEFQCGQLAAVQIPVPASDRTSTRARLSLPDDGPAQDAWAAGIVAARIVTSNGGPDLRSAVLPLALAPRIVSIDPDPLPAGSQTLTVGCHPKATAKTARLRLGSNEIQAEDDAAATASLKFKLDGAALEDGSLAVLIVDDIESQPVSFDQASGTFVFDDAQRVHRA